jgi:hypothetical protein
MANVTLSGLPQNLYPNSAAYIGIAKTALFFQTYTACFSIDTDTSKINIQGVENSAESWKTILQFWQDIDNWAQANPADVTPKIQRLSDMLIRLRKAADTDAPYDAYELILFFNIAIRPEYFLPFFFADSVYSLYVTLAKEYTYQMLFTRVQNDRQRAKDPNATIVTPQQVYPGYVPPPSTAGPLPSTPGTPVNPSAPGTNTAAKSTVWSVFLLVSIIVLLILILR